MKLRIYYINMFYSTNIDFPLIPRWPVIHLIFLYKPSTFQPWRLKQHVHPREWSLLQDDVRSWHHAVLYSHTKIPAEGSNRWLVWQHCLPWSQGAGVWGTMDPNDRHEGRFRFSNHYASRFFSSKPTGLLSTHKNIPPVSMQRKSAKFRRTWLRSW